MDNSEDILRVLTEDDDDNEFHGERDEKGAPEESEGLFSGLDPEMLVRMLGLFESLNQPDDNERFLLALKPLLREENRSKIDSALRLLKLFTLLPYIRESGLFDRLV